MAKPDDLLPTASDFMRSPRRKRRPSRCSDRGRAINQQEPGWENTPTGVPKEIYQLWAKYFRPRG